jgi:intracellular multiplication protein IcmD
MFNLKGGFMKVSKKYKMMLAVLASLTITSLAFAADGGGLGGVAEKVTTTIGSVGKMMVAISYLAGFGFLTFGVLKFKQHKDNPTQVTLGTPIVMTLIGAVLVFIGGFIAPLGKTFGVEDSAVGGFTGSGDFPGGGGAAK